MNTTDHRRIYTDTSPPGLDPRAGMYVETAPGSYPAVTGIIRTVGRGWCDVDPGGSAELVRVLTRSLRAFLTDHWT